VREGIYMHSKVRKDITSKGWGVASTLEGQIIKLADSVAYINHDIDDAIRAGILDESDLPRDAVAVLGDSHAERIDTMVCDMIDFNWWATGEATPPDPPIISMSAPVLAATNALRDFMFQHVYRNSQAKDDDKVRFIVIQLYQHFVEHPDAIPADLREIVARLGESPAQAALDYVAGMTDRYALKVFNSLYVPRTWEA
jgi:dGTPase